MSKTNKKESTDDKIIAIFRSTVISMVIAVLILCIGVGAFISSAIFVKSTTESLIMSGAAAFTGIFVVKTLISIHFYLEKIFRYLLNRTPDPVDDSKENQV